MKDDAVYTPSDCFEAFPAGLFVAAGFQPAGEKEQVGNLLPQLEAAGRAYYEFRAALMVKNNEGLTKTYNRFHDPDERSADIARLRELHAAMDRVVLDAYGWTDLKPRCEFLLDYEEDDDEESGGGRRRHPAVALPLAGRLPRRGAGPAAGAEQAMGGTGGAGGADRDNHGQAEESRRRPQEKGCRTPYTRDGRVKRPLACDVQPMTPVEVRSKLVDALPLDVLEYALPGHGGTPLRNHNRIVKRG